MLTHYDPFEANPSGIESQSVYIKLQVSDQHVSSDPSRPKLCTFSYETVITLETSLTGLYLMEASVSALVERIEDNRNTLNFDSDVAFAGRKRLACPVMMDVKTWVESMIVELRITHCKYKDGSTSNEVR
tara:strand:+ start:16821 stop:17210 length:390 start_codon:yes stop_codon:yes gene_type:complete